MRSLTKSCLSLVIGLLAHIACSSQTNTALEKARLKKTNYEVVFPMNEYLTTTNDTVPYPVLNKETLKKINTSSFTNIMDYGAKGDGLQADDNAIIKAFEACKDDGGVLFPKNKTFLIQNLIRIPLNKNITVSAYGATFKMAPKTGYNAIAFEGRDTGYNNQVIWLGGTFDGNKDYQAWPGSPTKDNNWTVTKGNYGLLTIRRAKFALVKDIVLTNTVYDGVNLFECELGVIADSKAYNGVELTYGHIRSQFGTGHQSTYFKCTRRNSQAVYFLNLDCKGGSIGVQYSTNKVSDSSLAVVNNCHFYNQTQDALHFESCRKIFIYQSTVGSDNSKKYHADVHISNSCEIASVKNCEFRNAKIDFRNASKLQLGAVEYCQFESVQSNNDSVILRTFIHNASYVGNCTFKGKTQEEQAKVKCVENSSFTDFVVAVNAINLIYKCQFNNGEVAVENAMKPLIKDCKFNNVKRYPSLDVSNKNFVDDTTLKSLLSKSISVVDNRKNFLGFVTR